MRANFEIGTLVTIMGMAAAPDRDVVATVSVRRAQNLREYLILRKDAGRDRRGAVIRKGHQ